MSKQKIIGYIYSEKEIDKSDLKLQIEWLKENYRCKKVFYDFDQNPVNNEKWDDNLANRPQFKILIRDMKTNDCMCVLNPSMDELLKIKFVC